MKPTREECLKAVMGMSLVIPFFPKIDFALAIIADTVREFVGNSEQLAWFEKAACASIRTWDDGGIPLLRALYCTKYAPDDGVPPIMEMVGMTAAELEGRFRAMELADNERRFEEFKRQAVLGPPENREALGLPVPISAMNQLKYHPEFDTKPLPDAVGPIPCPWCAQGNPRVRSSVSDRLVHTDTEVGRVLCKSRNPWPVPVDEPDPVQTPPVDPDASRTLDGGSPS
jgi:hypothetical protein